MNEVLPDKFHFHEPDTYKTIIVNQCYNIRPLVTTRFFALRVKIVQQYLWMFVKHKRSLNYMQMVVSMLWSFYMNLHETIIVSFTMWKFSINLSKTLSRIFKRMSVIYVDYYTDMYKTITCTCTLVYCKQLHDFLRRVWNGCH